MMKPRLVNHKRFQSFISIGHAFLRASLGGEPERRIFKKNPWHFSPKVKYVIVFAIIAVMLISIFAFLPKGNQSTNIVPQSDDPTASPSPTSQGQATDAPKNNIVTNLGQMISNIASGAPQILAPKPPGIIESAQTINSTVWKAVAANAWQYFQPGIGVDPNTGLPGAGLGYPYFTDWDLGVYIQAVIDANKTGLIGNDGDWGSSARLEKVVSFLETREVNATTGVPYWFYTSTGGGYITQSSIDVVDSGRLFVALNNLKIFNSSFASRVDDFVHNNVYNYHNRTDYAALVSGVKSDSLTSTSIYAYYVASGFASFWPNELSNAPDTILNNMLNAGNITTYGVSLPKASISCEPLLHSIFELPNNPKLMGLARNVSLAHEAKYNATGQYVAFSEGNSPSNGFIWEWVVTGSGDAWKITQSGSSLDINPVVYNKVAFSFLALYNTTFARNMVIYLEQRLPDPTKGYSDGADNSGNLVSSVGSNTNGLILNAAQYYIQNNP